MINILFHSAYAQQEFSALSIEIFFLFRCINMHGTRSKMDVGTEFVSRQKHWFLGVRRVTALFTTSATSSAPSSLARVICVSTYSPRVTYPPPILFLFSNLLASFLSFPSHLFFSLHFPPFFVKIWNSV